MGLSRSQTPVRIGGVRKGFASVHETPIRTAKGRMVEAVMVREPGHGGRYVAEVR